MTIDVLELRDFLDAAMREEIISELRLAAGMSATVYGKEEAGAVEPRIRKATQLAVSEEDARARDATTPGSEKRDRGAFWDHPWRVRRAAIPSLQKWRFLRSPPGRQHTTHLRSITIPQDLDHNLAKTAVEGGHA